jgi:hypothetical protein
VGWRPGVHERYLTAILRADGRKAYRLTQLETQCCRCLGRPSRRILPWETLHAIQHEPDMLTTPEPIDTTSLKALASHLHAIMRILGVSGSPMKIARSALALKGMSRPRPRLDSSCYGILASDCMDDAAQVDITTCEVYRSFFMSSQFRVANRQ